MTFFYRDRNRLPILIEHLKPIQTDVEEVTPTLRDIDKQDLASASLTERLLVRQSLRAVRCRFLFYDSVQLSACSWHSSDSSTLHNSRCHWSFIKERSRFLLLLSSKLELYLFHLGRTELLRGRERSLFKLSFLDLHFCDTLSVIKFISCDVKLI